MPDEFPKRTVESLWAPWRVEYFRAEHQSGRDFLGEAAATSDDAAHLVICRRKNCFLVLNKYPYSAGHLMAVPYRKTNRMEDLTDAEVIELWGLAIDAQRLLTDCVKAHGFNIGWNLGRAGGAGVVDHIHIHIVPRWVGDSNFMAVIGDTRIIPEALVPLYERLAEAKERLGIP
ncbi:MAG: HIT domain-containing protein [Terrimicrobiaceae bacterium]